MAALALALAAGCRNSPDGLTVYRQRIPGSPAVIYRAHAYYGGIGGVFVRGLVVADSNRAFEYSRSDLIPYYAIARVSADEVEIASSPEPHDSLSSSRYDAADPLVPTRVDRRLVGGLELVNNVYAGHVTGSAPASCGLRRYGFARFRETADSLVLYGVSHDFGPRLPESVGFRKGSVTAELDGGGHVAKLTIEEFVTGVVQGYLPSNRLTPLPLPMRCVATYEFIPTGPSGQPVSDYGVFKVVSSYLRTS